MSDDATFPLPDPGASAGSANDQARAARRGLRRHQTQWLALTVLIVASALVHGLPPALNPVLVALGVVLAVRGVLRARSQRSELLRARGPAPTHDLMAAVSWRADPRGDMARSFARAANWWAVFALAATGYVIVWLKLR